MRPTKYRKDKTPIFIGKLYQMLLKEDNKNIISWAQQENAFIILDINQFTQHILPKYFKHANYYSFVRQLNMYNFNKIRYCVNGVESEHVYQHHLFRKGCIENLKLIRRKEPVFKCQSLMPYNRNYEENVEKFQNDEQQPQDIFDRLQNVREKQQKLQQICLTLIRQNQILMAQNQQLAHKVKKQSRKKERILDQVFRIIGVSITEFWDQFCQDTETLEQKTNKFQQLYQMLMNFIQQNDLPKILKTLEFYIIPNEKKKKIKTFKVINPNQETNFLSSYTDEEVEEFINTTNIMLEQKCNNFNK